MGDIRYMSRPLVSVIMSVFNCEKYIEQSIESILKQSFKDFEIIIFNDCSTDNTWEIINSKDYMGINHNLINNIRNNVGCGKGRDIVINMAKGEYIFIQDGDDISYKKRLEKQMKFMNNNVDVFCVGSWADRVDERGYNIGEMVYPPLCHNDCVDSIFNKINPIIDPSSCFRKKHYVELGGYSDRWNLVPDMNLWMKAMVKRYKFANIGEKLVAHRIHQESVMAKYGKEATRQHYNMHKELLSGLKKEGFKE
jgi:glycosyltransferase involved in cell wall biosynthesis